MRWVQRATVLVLANLSQQAAKPEIELISRCRTGRVNMHYPGVWFLSTHGGAILSDGANLADITGAPIPLRIGSREVMVRPFNIDTLGLATRRCQMERVAALIPAGEILAALAGHSKEVVCAAIEQCKADRERAHNPTSGETMEWVFGDPLRIAQVLIDCVVGEWKPSTIELALSLNANPDFMERWKEASGLGENPTRRPSASSKAARAAKNQSQK